jgi:hypothetical protein
VRYLLQGSGAEHQVDYTALRTELEAMTPSYAGSSMSASVTGAQDKSDPSFFRGAGTLLDIWVFVNL